MDCQTAQENIPAYVNHAATEEQITAIEEHLCICNTCRQFLSQLLEKPAKTFQSKEREAVAIKNLSLPEVSNLVILGISISALLFLIYLFLKR